jgi:hypothetical protein
MATQVKVIISKDYIYATYVKTICFKKFYLNEDEKHEALNEAKSVAFSYADGFGNVLASIVIMDYQEMNDNDIFAYLDQCHLNNPKMYNYTK